MICPNCVNGRESECWGKTKHKTWCDWLGYPHDTVILQSQFCKHLRASDTYCPTCGKVFDGKGNQIESTTTEEPPLDLGYLSLPKETQRDIEDNFYPTHDTGQQDYIPGSDTETPTS